MALPHEAVVLLAFGGPNAPEEIRPFLARVLRGVRVPPERAEEVVRHYEAVGGRSPLADITFLQARALAKIFDQMALSLPVYVAFRHSAPFIRETLEKMMADGIKRALALILSAHETEASWQRYQTNVAEARKEIGGSAPEIDYCCRWHNHPLFIETWGDQIEEELEKIAAERRVNVPLVFTAHSVPVAMARRSPYVGQLEESCRLVAAEIGHPHWTLAYQSRSGNPGEPWLDPDIDEVLRRTAQQNAREVVVAPIGFVSEHVEVLYDLDIEAKRTAQSLGLDFFRARTPNDHPTFIRMIADVIETQRSAIGRHR